MEALEPVRELPVRQTASVAHQGITVRRHGHRTSDRVEKRLHRKIIASVPGSVDHPTLRSRSMGDQKTTKKGVTPPKGRPTRGRNEVDENRRAFGPTAQWIAAAFLVALIFVTVIVLLDGGDFNPFDGGTPAG